MSPDTEARALRVVLKLVDTQIAQSDPEGRLSDTRKLIAEALRGRDDDWLTEQVFVMAANLQNELLRADNLAEDIQNLKLTVHNLKGAVVKLLEDEIAQLEKTLPDASGGKFAKKFAANVLRSLIPRIQSLQWDIRIL